MAQEKKLIVGNWKMNFDLHEASLFLHKLSSLVKPRRDVEVVITPNTLTLQSLSLQINLRQFKLAAQNFYWRDSGAYTGEVSASMLRGIVQYALIGHSERRNIFNEDDKDIRNKVEAAIRNEIRPILCIGETAWERAAGETDDVIRDQLIGGLANVTSHDIDKVVIAYEPVWAISPAKSATPDDVMAALKTIRDQLNYLYGKKAAESVQLLYGGDVGSENVASYLGLDDINGLLIGRASLNPEAFNDIIKKAHRPNTKLLKK